MRAALRRLVQSPAFTELLAASRGGAERTTQRAPDDAAQIYRLLKGLQSLADGTTGRPTAAERIRRKQMMASGSAPRQSRAGETRDGHPEFHPV